MINIANVKRNNYLRLSFLLKLFIFDKHILGMFAVLGRDRRGWLWTGSLNETGTVFFCFNFGVNRRTWLEFGWRG